MNPISQQVIFISLIFVIIIIALLLLEQKFFLRKRNDELLPRLIINFSLSILSFIIVYFVVFPAQTKTLEFTSSVNFGLMRLVQ